MFRKEVKLAALSAVPVEPTIEYGGSRPSSSRRCYFYGIISPILAPPVESDSPVAVVVAPLEVAFFLEPAAIDSVFPAEPVELFYVGVTKAVPVVVPASLVVPASSEAIGLAAPSASPV